MTLDELKAKVEKHREGLKEKVGKPCVFSEHGPVGTSLIDALVATIETQQAQIDELKQKLG